MCVFSLGPVWFLQGSIVLKEARQLPFTAPGGNKQSGRGSYLALLLGQEAEGGTLLGSHCITTHSCRARREMKR